MKFYSTNNKKLCTSLEEVIVRGLAPDGGLFMPERVPMLPKEFFETIEQLSFQEIAYRVADAFFGEDIPEPALREIVNGTLEFDCPLHEVGDGLYALELFHGPTLAFKDVGARFMARMLRYYSQEKLAVLVATSGDTGSAVANGFLGVEGILVYVLYPKGKVSPIQECQFTTLGQNITALEIDGTFDDCQRLVKTAFGDEELKAHIKLTSANSINVARFLPQAFYYFWAYAQLKRMSKHEHVTICVPSGNFGNICAGLFAKRMGLPIDHFIAANNENDVFYNYLQTGTYTPRASVQTIANAMDVGAPSNFARILDLYNHDHAAICQDISGYRMSDEEIEKEIRNAYNHYNYICDPHGAVAYGALHHWMENGRWKMENGKWKMDGKCNMEYVGVFLETAHPAKFKGTIDRVLGKDIEIPAKLQAFMTGEKQSIELSSEYKDFKRYLEM